MADAVEQTELLAAAPGTALVPGKGPQMPVPGGWKPTEEQDADDTSETGEEGQTAETAESDAPEENHINIEETGEELQEKEDTVSEETNGKITAKKPDRSLKKNRNPNRSLIRMRRLIRMYWD